MAAVGGQTVEAQRDRPDAAMRCRSAERGEGKVAARVFGRGVLAVDGDVRDAQVVVDGAVLGTTPFRGQLPRRDRDVKLAVRLAGYADRVITAPGSRAISERLTLVRSPASPPRTAKPDRNKSINPF